MIKTIKNIQALSTFKQNFFHNCAITLSEISASAPANATLSLESFWLSLFCG
jgi:hypothetical protein